MRKQALSLAVVIAGSYPATSNALSLGDIESNSNLNQPLRAKIELLSTTPQEAQQLQVRLAPASVFNRVGIERPTFLNSLQFTSTVQNGRPVILVSSDQPITEPFVNFLLEVSWPQGQLLKEYTVMLDPPVLMQPGTALATNEAAVRAEPRSTGVVNRPAPVARPRPAAQPAAQPRVQPVAAQPEAAAAAEVAPAPQAVERAERPAGSGGSRTYRVRQGDTLFKVATRMAEPGTNVDQMMLALYRANPQAFIDNNINGLKSGAVLRAPAAGKAQSVSRAEARRQVRQQYAEWQKFRTNLAKTTTPQQAATAATTARPTAAPAQAKNAATPADKARLEVLGSKDKAAAGERISAAGKARLDELEKELSLARESLVARQRENEELKSRVNELDSVLQKKNRLIALRDDQLAQLERQLAQTKGSASPVNAATPATPAPNTANATLGTATPTPTPAPVAPPVTTAPTPTPVIPPTATGQTPRPIPQGQVPATGQTTQPRPSDTDLQNYMGNVAGGNNTVVRTEPPVQQGVTPAPTPTPVRPATSPTPAPVAAQRPVAVTPVTPVIPANQADGKPSSPFMDEQSTGDDLMNLLTSPLIWKIGAGALLSLLLLGLLSRFLGRRKTATDKAATQKEASFDIDDHVPAIRPDQGEMPYGDLEQQLAKAEQSHHVNYDDPFGTGANANHDDFGLANTAVTPQAATADEDEVLMEANVYIAYGLHQQAESELRKALEKYPDNLQYRHKLLENYFAANNREAFDEQAELFVQASGGRDSQLWKDIVNWGAKISPDNMLYRTAKGTTAKLAAAGTAAVAGAASVAANAFTDQESTSFVEPKSAVSHADVNLDAGEVDQAFEQLAKANLNIDDDFDFDLGDLEQQLGPVDSSLDRVASDHNLELPAHPSLSASADLTSSLADTPEALELEAELEEADYPTDDGLDFDLDSLMKELPELDQEFTPRSTISEPMDLDSLMNELSDEALASTPPSSRLTTPLAKPVEPSDEFEDALDFDFGDATLPDVPAAASTKVAAVSEEADDLLDLSLDDLSLDPLDATPTAIAAASGVVAAPVAVASKAEEAVKATNLNLHLDKETGIKKILPQDTFYTTPEPRPANEDDSWLGDIDDALSFLDMPDDEIDLHEAHISTKLDLARAYLDMGDIEGARSTLEEVMVEGNDNQRREAETLLHQTG